MKKRSTRMDIGRKRPPLQDQMDRLRRRNKRLLKALDAERAAWHERCPKGHLVRHDDCDIMCYFTAIDPLPKTSVIAEKPTPGVAHEWIVASLPYSAGWWWRVPYGWLLSFWKWVTQ